MDGQAKQEEINKFEMDYGFDKDMFAFSRGGVLPTTASICNNLVKITKKKQQRKRARHEEEDLAPSSESEGSDDDNAGQSPSKRRKLAAWERRPRKHGIVRSTREGCWPTCISRDGHNQHWQGRSEDMMAFDDFALCCLSGSEELSVTVEGRAIQDAYRKYWQSHPNVSHVLTPNVLGYCCALRFCKTDVSRRILYRGVKVIGQ